MNVGLTLHGSGPAVGNQRQTCGPQGEEPGILMPAAEKRASGRGLLSME